jgi:hypothetical protein
MLKLNSDYHSKMINRRTDKYDSTIQYLETKNFEEIKNIGLNILSSSITSLRSFSHSELSIENPTVHRMIVFSVTDSLENIPKYIVDENKKFLIEDIAFLFQVIENINVLLTEEGIDNMFVRDFLL